MSLASFNQRLKPWMLPIAMVCGAFFHEPINHVQWCVPYLIFTMLLITFCRVRPSELRVDRMIWQLLAVQVFGSVGIFWLLRPLGLPLAQAVMVCVLCPTATAAPVVTGMLGGSIGRVATYSIVSNITTAVLAPGAICVVWFVGRYIVCRRIQTDCGQGRANDSVSLRIGVGIIFYRTPGARGSCRWSENHVLPLVCVVTSRCWQVGQLCAAGTRRGHTPDDSHGHRGRGSVRAAILYRAAHRGAI